MANLIIYGTLPSANEYIKACRTNKYVAAKMKKDAEQHITAYIKEQIPDVHYEKTCELKFRWYMPNKKKDIDNIAFSKKYVLDALVSNQTIIADGWRGVIGFTDEFFIDPTNPRIEVEINERG